MSEPAAVFKAHFSKALNEVEGVTPDAMAAVLEASYDLLCKLHHKITPAEKCVNPRSEHLLSLNYELAEERDDYYKPPRDRAGIDARVERFEAKQLKTLYAAVKADLQKEKESGEDGDSDSGGVDPGDDEFDPAEVFDEEDEDSGTLFFPFVFEYKTGVKGALTKNHYHAHYNIEHSSCELLKQYFNDRSEKMIHDQARSASNIVNRFTLYVMTDGFSRRVPPFNVSKFLRKALGMEAQWLKEQRDLGLQKERLDTMGQQLVDFYTFLYSHADLDDEVEGSMRAEKGKARAERAKNLFARQKPSCLNSIDDMLTNPDKYKDLKELMQFALHKRYQGKLARLKEMMKPTDEISDTYREWLQEMVDLADTGEPITSKSRTEAMYRFVVGVMISVICVRQGHRPCVLYRMKKKEFDACKHPGRCETLTNENGETSVARVIYVADHKTSQRGVAGIVLEDTEFQIFSFYEQYLRPIADNRDGTTDEFFLLQPDGQVYKEYKGLSSAWKQWLVDIYGSKTDPGVFTVYQARRAISSDNLRGVIVPSSQDQKRVASYLQHGLYTERTYYKRETVLETINNASLVAKILWHSAEPLCPGPKKASVNADADADADSSEDEEEFDEEERMPVPGGEEEEEEEEPPVFLQHNGDRKGLERAFPQILNYAVDLPEKESFTAYLRGDTSDKIETNKRYQAIRHYYLRKRNLRFIDAVVPQALHCDSLESTHKFCKQFCPEYYGRQVSDSCPPKQGKKVWPKLIHDIFGEIKSKILVASFAESAIEVTEEEAGPSSETQSPKKKEKKGKDKDKKKEALASRSEEEEPIREKRKEKSPRTGEDGHAGNSQKQAESAEDPQSIGVTEEEAGVPTEAQSQQKKAKKRKEMEKHRSQSVEEEVEGEPLPKKQKEKSPRTGGDGHAGDTQRAEKKKEKKKKSHDSERDDASTSAEPSPERQSGKSREKASRERSEGDGHAGNAQKEAESGGQSEALDSHAGDTQASSSSQQAGAPKQSTKRGKERRIEKSQMKLRRLETQNWTRVEVAPATLPNGTSIGSGVFANQDLPIGLKVCNYEGETITRKEFQKRVREGAYEAYKDEEVNSYLQEMEEPVVSSLFVKEGIPEALRERDDVVILAHENDQKGFGHKINGTYDHSCINVRPSNELIPVYEDGEIVGYRPVIYFITTRPVKKGEQILRDYGDKYKWAELGFTKVTCPTCGGERDVKQ